MEEAEEEEEDAGGREAGFLLVAFDESVFSLVWLSNIFSRATPHFISVCRGTLRGKENLNPQLWGGVQSIV